MYCNNASYFSSILVHAWIWQDLSTSRIVRVEILCVLHVHFDLEGARHADLENKHDLVIRFHYKLMFALKKKIPFFFCVCSSAHPCFLSTRAFHVHTLCSSGKLP